MALLARPRILDALFDTNSGATLITASSGFGKSVAVRQFLAATPKTAIHYEARASYKTFVPFVRGFVDAAARVIPGLQTTFPGAIEYAMQSPKPYEEIAVWLLDHLSGSTAEVIAIEDAHHAGADEQVRLLLARLIQSSAPKVRWIFTSRDANSVPLEDVAKAGVPISTIDAEQLRFTRVEAEIIARDAGLSRDLIDSLYSLTGGWPATFHLGAHVFDGGRVPVEHAYAFFAQAYFVRCREDVQSLLMGAAVLTDIDEELLEKSPWASCTERVRDLARNGLVFSARAGGRYVFHELFRRFLLERIGPPGSGGRRSAMTYGASLLERCGRTADALSLFAAGDDVANVVRICVQHGFDLVDKGNLDLIRRAIAMAGDDRLHKSASLMALRAIDEAQSGRHDTAESWYMHALDLAVTPELKATIAYRHALDRIRQGRPGSVEILERYIETPELPIELLASMRSALATAYVLAGRFDDANITIAQALRLIPLAPNMSLQAKIYQHSGWVTLFTGDPSLAKQYSVRAIELATKCGLFDVAARAYSVLYNVAYEIEDDMKAALDFMNKIWDCGLKCGEQKLRLYALLGTFDIAADMGDLQTLLRVERMMDLYEVDYADQAIDEALLPSQALRLAAAGDFLEAFRLLSPTVERQSNDDRRALRLAEIAFYAVAAGHTVEASKAVSEAEKCIKAIQSNICRTVRIKVMVLVVLYMLGRRSEARLWLRNIEGTARGSSPRARALIAAAQALLHRWENENGYDQLLDALDLLSQADFGGLAAVFAALPMQPIASVA